MNAGFVVKIRVGTNHCGRNWRLEDVEDGEGHQSTFRKGIRRAWKREDGSTHARARRFSTATEQGAAVHETPRVAWLERERRSTTKNETKESREKDNYDDAEIALKKTRQVSVLV